MPLDATGDAQVFDLQQGTYQITLTGCDTRPDLALDAIVAIPYGEWNLYFIQPQLKCVQNNEQEFGVITKCHLFMHLWAVNIIKQSRCV